MAFTSEQIDSITTLMDVYIAARRPPEHMRAQLDLGWRFDGLSLFIFEIRPQWNDHSVILHHDFAKATWVESKKQWNIYWHRASGKWQVYEPLQWAGNLQRFLLEVTKDPHHCFRG
ncbi:DUF3024 domain-containing protein [Cnuella takakiae]|nr:DUF3024 domain-containing protein [Cnuella takakiae]OLY90758.1 hypothetical protein BUE76_01725 [Cnuella takakiae]